MLWGYLLPRERLIGDAFVWIGSVYINQMDIKVINGRTLSLVSVGKKKYYHIQRIDHGKI